MPNPYLAVLAIVAGVTIFQVGNAVISTFQPIRLKLDGHGDVSVGLVATAHALGFVVGCIVCTRVIRAFGHIRAFAIFAAACGATSLAFAITVDPLLWIPLRFVVGFASAGLFTVAESWLNDRTPPDARGRIISVYMLATKLAYGGGQMLLATGDIHTLIFFMMASFCYSLSIIPVAMNQASSPSVPQITTMGLRQLYRIAPAAAVGCLATGLINSAVINLAPAYGTEIGLSGVVLAFLLATLQFSSLVLQWPIGWLSDRYDRRLVIVACEGVVVVLSLAVALLGHLSIVLLYILFGLWAGFALSIYAVCIAHANDRAPPGATVALSSTLLLSWAVGSVVGPTVASVAMEQFGRDALFYYAALIALLCGGFVLWRVTRRPSAPVEERDRFVNVPATSPGVLALDPRAPADPRAGQAIGRP